MVVPPCRASGTDMHVFGNVLWDLCLVMEHGKGQESVVYLWHGHCRRRIGWSHCSASIRCCPDNMCTDDVEESLRWNEVVAKPSDNAPRMHQCGLGAAPLRALACRSTHQFLWAGRITALAQMHSCLPLLPQQTCTTATMDATPAHGCQTWMTVKSASPCRTTLPAPLHHTCHSTHAPRRVHSSLQSS